MTMTQTSSSDSTAFVIHPATRLGPVHLIVADLDRQIAFYERLLGFKLHRREGTQAGMGAGREDLLVLTQLDGARRVGGTTGLYHFAVLLPNRRELARAIMRLFTAQHPNYPTDHIMTETTYLDDPEGNGIELYVDTPEDGFFGFANGVFVAQRADGTPSDGREPLDLDVLMRDLSPDDPLDAPVPEETKIGHVHLHVAHLAEAVRFYHEILGFDLMGMAAAFRAAFVSAGGYHHHIGLNTWAGEGAPPPPPLGARGLRYFTIVLPDDKELRKVMERVERAGIPTEQTEGGILLRDPSQNGVLLTA